MIRLGVFGTAGLLVLCFATLLVGCGGSSSPPADSEALGPPGDGLFFFIQISDTQLGFTNANRDSGPEIANFRKAVEHINRLRPAFVVISGDLINSAHHIGQTREFWEVAHEISPDIPLHLVVGNHDLLRATAESMERYRSSFGEDHYTFSFGNTEFIVLNSTLIREPEADAALRAAQRTWFEDQLALARGRNPSHILVLSHHPWFVYGPDEADSYLNIPQAARYDYLNLMDRYRVDYAFCGHLHREASGRYGGISVITTSALSKPLGRDPVGLRIVRVYTRRVLHTYYALDRVPESVTM